MSRVAWRATTMVACLAFLLPCARAQQQEGIVVELDTAQGLAARSYDAGWKRAYPEEGATWKDAVVTGKPGARIRATVNIPFTATYEVNLRLAQQGSQERLRIGGATYPVLAGGSYAGPQAPRQWVDLPVAAQQLKAGPVIVELEHVGRASDAQAVGPPLAFVDFVHLRPVSLPAGKVVIAGVSVTDETGQAATLPLNGDTLTISASIQNNCAVMLPQSHLTCSERGQEVVRAWTDAVQPGAQTTAQVQWRAEGGKHVLTLAVVPAARAEGIDASGATATISIGVAGTGRPGLLGQLAVLDAGTQRPVSQAIAGVPLVVKVTAENVGDVLADSVRATVRANGEPLPPALLAIGNIGPRQRGEGDLEWSPEPGEYTLSVELMAANFDARFGEPSSEVKVTVVAKSFPWPIALGAAAGASLMGLLLVMLAVRTRRRRAQADLEAGEMRTCPRCGRAYPAEVHYCPDDGARLG